MAISNRSGTFPSPDTGRLEAAARFMNDELGLGGADGASRHRVTVVENSGQSRAVGGQIVHDRAIDEARALARFSPPQRLAYAKTHKMITRLGQVLRKHSISQEDFYEWLEMYRKSIASFDDSNARAYRDFLARQGDEPRVRLSPEERWLTDSSDILHAANLIGMSLRREGRRAAIHLTRDWVEMMGRNPEDQGEIALATRLLLRRYARQRGIRISTEELRSLLAN